MTLLATRSALMAYSSLTCIHDFAINRSGRDALLATPSWMRYLCDFLVGGLCVHMDAWHGHGILTGCLESVQGVIGPGGVQWMTAGRGIVHSEMPKVTEGDLWGFQLWINLPAQDKMVKPR